MVMAVSSFTFRDETPPVSDMIMAVSSFTFRDEKPPVSHMIMTVSSFTGGMRYHLYLTWSWLSLPSHSGMRHHLYLT